MKVLADFGIYIFLLAMVIWNVNNIKKEREEMERLREELKCGVFVPECDCDE